jgi:hypothetical protein
MHAAAILPLLARDLDVLGQRRGYRVFRLKQRSTLTPNPEIEAAARAKRERRAAKALSDAVERGQRIFDGQ